MTERENGGSPLTRRGLLAGLAGTAGVGALGGAGTRALLGDTETVPGELLGNPYTGGRLDLELRCWGEAGCESNGDGVTFTMTEIDPPAAGRAGTTLTVRGTPAWVWLRSSATSDSPVADHVFVTLTYGDGTAVTDSDGEAIEQWSLGRFLERLEAGTRLSGHGDDAVFPDGSSRSLNLAWTFPERDPSLSGEALAFTLEFAAVQYRADTTADTPWNWNNE